MDNLDRIATQGRVRTSIDAWLRTALLILVAICFTILAYKFAISPISFTFKDISFDQLLSTVLAIFAIVISIIFYFAAVQSASDFYQQMYIFTKDTSTVLGTIQAGFTAKLEGLHTQYSAISTRLDPIQSVMLSLSAAAKGVGAEVGNQRVDQLSKLKDAIGSADIPEKARNELNQVFQEVHASSEQERLALAKNIEKLAHATSLASLPRNVIELLSLEFASQGTSSARGILSTAQQEAMLRQKLQQFLESLSLGALEEFRSNGLVARGGREPTDRALEIVRALAGGHA